MAQRARHAVVGEPIGVTPLERIVVRRKMLENAALSPFGARFGARHGHVTRGAFILDRSALLRMIDRFAAHTSLPVRIARRVRHHRRAPARANRHIFTGRCRKAVVTCHTPIRGLEHFAVRIGRRIHGNGHHRQRQPCPRQCGRCSRGSGDERDREEVFTSHRTSFRRTSPTGNTSARSCLDSPAR